MRIKFCPNCGTALELKEFEQKQRAFCPRCQRIHFKQLKVGAGALLEQDEKLLLIQRTNAPFKHCWNLPSGYAEADESPSQTVVREVFEETGLHVEVELLIDVYFFADDPRGNGILIIYTCHPTGGTLMATPEGANPTFFAMNDIPKDLAGGGHNQAICAWKSALLKSRNCLSRITS
jgi:ADP-ribose pyrophosphatase YjhB (NUDIX family)